MILFPLGVTFQQITEMEVSTNVAVVFVLIC